MFVCAVQEKNKQNEFMRDDRLIERGAQRRREAKSEKRKRKESSHPTNSTTLGQVASLLANISLLRLAAVAWDCPIAYGRSPIASGSEHDVLASGNGAWEWSASEPHPYQGTVKRYSRMSNQQVLTTLGRALPLPLPLCGIRFTKQAKITTGSAEGNRQQPPLLPSLPTTNMFRPFQMLLQRGQVGSDTVLSEAQQSETLLINRIRQNRREKSRGRPSFFRLRALTASRLQGYVVIAGILIGSAVVLGPWMINEYQEMLGLRYTPLDPRHMPALSCEWWETEWRKMNPTWRRGESDEGFYESSLGFLESVTGRDVHTAEGWRATRPGKPRATTTPATALVPLCGDTPMIGVLGQKGYLVDAVDASPTAIRAAVERTERTLPPSYFNTRVKLHWSDIFSPALWGAASPLQQHAAAAAATASTGGSPSSTTSWWRRHQDGPSPASSSSSATGPQYDIIYERQGITSIPLDQRSDYAHLLSQALKPDGVLYVEGIFRTGRVANNKRAGPPFGLSRREIKELFPGSTEGRNAQTGSNAGFHVVCEEKKDALVKLSREDRVLQRIPKELYVTPFHCAVFRDAAVNHERLAALRKKREGMEGGAEEVRRAWDATCGQGAKNDMPTHCTSLFSLTLTLTLTHTLTHSLVLVLACLRGSDMNLWQSPPPPTSHPPHHPYTHTQAP
eukprot:gene7876-5503_t